MTENENPEKVYIVAGNPEWWDHAQGEGVEPYIRARSLQGSFYAGNRPTGKFMALFSDGSGGGLFALDRGNEDRDVYRTAEGDIIGYADKDGYEWFIDAGYSIWVRLPQDFKLFYEME